MAVSREFDATGTPTALDAALSLETGVTYWVQNVDVLAALRFRAAATQPAATDRSHVIASGGSVYIKPDDDPVWLWTDGGSCACIVTEAQ